MWHLELPEMKPEVAVVALLDFPSSALESSACIEGFERFRFLVRMVPLLLGRAIHGPIPV